MEATLIFVIFLLEGLWETKAESVTGSAGQTITITCSHSNAYSNVKYFCKDECTDKDILIKTSDKNKESNKKYRIKDEGNTFSVTISDLQVSDSRTYWCGIERVGVDTYNEVILEVLANTDNAAHKDGYFSQTLLYTGVTLGVVVLVLGMALLIFFRHRNGNISTSSGNYHDAVYTPSIQKKDALHDKDAFPSKKDQETDRGTDSFSTSQNLDASEPLKQSDDLFYTTVSFKNSTECSSIRPYSVTAIYSSPKHESTADSTIYDNI
ncbi:uncharacterized protein LOC115786486 [Archocentrus centrarchus]|uniref:uncharacterized protein LOC115786486 n=1 Tax=Archocentrus centrarchus TaxID=63155 RepID=UPI0011E9C335|nr:uncharacterized protein LOC115786486 [Archocentrus centrarchus]